MIFPICEAALPNVSHLQDILSAKWGGTKRIKKVGGQKTTMASLFKNVLWLQIFEKASLEIRHKGG